ncbi:MAG: EAL domain-containing protein [Pseudomonadota bacterium]
MNETQSDGYKNIVEMSPDAILIERDHKIIFANLGALKLLGVQHHHEIIGKALLDFIVPEYKDEAGSHFKRIISGEQEMQPFESKFLQLNGMIKDIEMSNSTFEYDGGIAIQVVAHDISRHKQYQEELRQQALHDVLTGLPNRALLIEHLKQAMALADRHKHLVYVLFFDLDRFKYINDTLGHDAGDQLLKTVTSRILECVRKCDTLARLGGDEFVLILNGITDQERMASLLQKMMLRISEPMVLKNEEIIVTCSIGLSVYPQDGQDVSILLKCADAAMYRAKEQGRNQLQHFSQAMHSQINERLAMESRLRRVLERNEFRLYYQPFINIKTGKIVGAEALIRWQHPELDILPPVRFIALAEEIGVIVEIGRWVLKTACLQAKEWQNQGLGLERISVNISAQQLMYSKFKEDIELALHDSGLAPQCLELEITESMSMANPEETVKLLEQLKAMGVSLAIDDFGTGYSNLAYLKRFPVDRLKIDRAFIRDITHDPNDSMLTHAMIMMAHNLNLSVVAEGVESVSQLDILKLHDCDEFQGYYFSPPISVADFTQLLTQKKSLHTIIAPTKVIYPAPESNDDVRFNDLLEILNIALERTRSEYGDFTLEPSIKMTEARFLNELSQGVNINIAWSSTSIEKEKAFLPIRIPLRKGILGYRVGLIHQSKQSLINTINKVDDLKSIKIGQGVGWGDINIYDHSKIPIICALYPDLFKMTASGYLDFFPRGITEAVIELEQHKLEMPMINIEETLILHYPWPYYFFLNKKDEKLAERIETGIQYMLKDGSFDDLFFKYNESAIQRINFKSRRIINLENPLLPPETPLSEKKLWWHPY